MIWLALIFSQAFAMSRGEYVLRVAGCVHCHTQSPSEPLAGGRRLATPFGTFFTPNISPDRETGIGAWTFEQFAKAVREGVSPSGTVYYPAFPYRSYARMSDEDVNELFNHLMSRPAFRRHNIAHELQFPYDYRWLINFWRLLFFGAQPDLPSRGAYLVEALGHCTECHTERNSMGGLKSAMWMGGSKEKLEGRVIPNITPDMETGLGAWSMFDWELFLTSGFRPNGSSVGGEMAFVVQGTAALTPEDRAAVIDYLMNLPPVQNRVVAP